MNAADVIVTFADATRHVGVIGQSGFGKSAGVIRPALDRLISSGCSGLVKDAKSEYLYLATDHPGRVVKIGAGDDCMPMNLIGGMSVAVFREWLEQCRTHSRDGYWGSTAVEDAVLVLMYQRARGREPTLETVVTALLDPGGFVREFDAWLDKTVVLPAELAEAIAAQQIQAFGILSLGGSKVISYDARRSESGRAMEQYTWQIQHLLPGMRAAIGDPRIRRGLCAPQSLDLHDLIYRQRQTLVVDLPESEFGGAADVLSRLVRARFFSAILSYPRHRAEGYGRDRFTFYCADEYQHHIVVGGGGSRRGVYDDSVAFDRLRSAGHINLIATQSVSALRAQVPTTVPREAVDGLLQNVGTLIAFASNDSETGLHLASRLPPLLSEPVRGLAGGGLRRGEALVLSSYLSRHDDGLVAAVRTGGVAGSPWMGRHIHRAPSAISPARYARPGGSHVPNPHCTSVDAWLEIASAAFTKAHAQLLEDIRGSYECGGGGNVGRTRLVLGDRAAGFALSLDDSEPLHSKLLVQGFGLASEYCEIGLPLAPLRRLAVSVPETMLADEQEFNALEVHVEEHPLTLVRSALTASVVTLMWDEVGTFNLEIGHWRILASAAEHYYKMLVEATKAISAADPEILL